MPDYFVQATIFPTSNLNADAATNTWAITAVDVAQLNGVVFDTLQNFYIGLQSIFPNTVRQDDHLLKAYNRANAIPRAPVAQRRFNFPGVPGGAPLPPEVSMCMSFQGNQVSGQAQARRRGRVYLGPIRQDRVGTDGRPTAGLITTIRDAGDYLVDASAAATWQWEVWSTVNNAAAAVTNGWVDNEFDTQRRRGRVATSRSTFAV